MVTLYLELNEILARLFNFDYTYFLPFHLATTLPVFETTTEVETTTVHAGLSETTTESNSTYIFISYNKHKI